MNRNRNIKVTSGEVSNRNEYYVIGNCSKGDTCYKVANNLVELCSSVLLKVKLVGKLNI